MSGIAGGHLSVRVDRRDSPPHGGAAGEWIHEQQLDPHGLEGFIGYDEIREITAEWIEWPQEPIPPRFHEDGDESEWLKNL